MPRFLLDVKSCPFFADAVRIFLCDLLTFVLFYLKQDCGQTGPLLAGFLNAPQATFAAKVTREDDGSFIVDRETDAGKDLIFDTFAYFGNAKLIVLMCTSHRN